MSSRVPGQSQPDLSNLSLCELLFDIVTGGFGWRMSSDEVLALERETDKISGFVGAPFENW